MTKHIALADDEDFIHVLIESALTPEFSIAAFSDGQSLLDYVNAHPTDVILLDVEMPGMSGHDVCGALKDDFSLQDIPVVFISGRDDLESRLKAYEAGAEDYIVKPVHADKLRSKVRVVSRMLENRRELANRSSEAQKAAFAAMISMGDMGSVMEFMRQSFTCHNADQLLGAIANYYGIAGLSGGAQLRGDEGICSLLIGDAAPLTSSVLDGIRESGRIFEFKNRLAINYPQCSLLVSNLPLDDPERCGRIRDNFALVAEAAEIRLTAIDAAARLASVGGQAEDAAALATTTARRYMEQAQRYRDEVAGRMNTLVMDLERSFVHLGLREIQETELVELVKHAAKDVLASAAPLQSFEQDFEGVIGKLAGIARLTTKPH